VGLARLPVDPGQCTNLASLTPIRGKPLAMTFFEAYNVVIKKFNSEVEKWNLYWQDAQQVYQS
jgi:hypothetical protein